MRKRLVLIAALLLCSVAAGAAEESIEALTERVFALAKKQLKLLDTQLGEAETPRTLNPDGTLCKEGVNWWCSGFFSGSLWYTYEFTGDPEFKSLAEKRTRELAPLLDMETDHDIGFMINCSYGNALRITADTAAYRGAILRGAAKLAARFEPDAGVTRSWSGEWTKKHGWDIPVIIDNMMNLEILLNACRMNGDRELYKVATTHANTTIAHHFRPDYSCYHVVNYSAADGSVIGRQTHQGFSDESAWARGQAWALYGFTMMYVKTGDEKYFKQADYIAKYIIRNLPEDGIPYWDFSCPGDLRDASAGAIMASAFVQLYEITGRKQFLDVADTQIRTLAGDGYLSGSGANHGFLLMHSVGYKPAGSEVDVPLTYADYYFLEALLRRRRTTSHPRLFLDDKTWDGICAQLKDGGNKALDILHGNIMEEAAKLPDDPVVWGLDESGTRILAQSREGMKRIMYDAYAYRFTSDRRYLEHAERTIREVCAMPDWNAWHFLDTAEMSVALAIGYDWLYDDLPEDLKQLMVKTIKDYSFTEAFDFDKAWFYSRSHNWNQVCNGGLAMAALAFREDCGPVAGNVIRNAVRTNRDQLDTIYGPDGCYPEGPNYWNYGNSYQMLLNGSFDSALGDDFGLSLAKGFDRAGDFEVACYGADGKMFNYYDNSIKASPAITLWYFAWRFDKPQLLARELEFLLSGSPYYNKDSRILPIIMAYASRMDAGGIPAPQTAMYVGHGPNPIATVRGADADGEWFLGVKGGKASNNHGHADAGSFVFDHGGVRWAADPGAIKYTKAEAELKARGGDFWNRDQESLRWTIWPIGNEWHNTLTVNGRTHNVADTAKIISAVDTTGLKSVTVDFGKVLGEDIASASRTIELRDGATLTITDCVKAAKNSHICFTLVSEAVPETDGRHLVLRSGGKTVTVTTSGPKATVSIADAPDAAAAGLSVVRIEYDIKAGRTRKFSTLMKFTSP